MLRRQRLNCGQPRKRSSKFGGIFDIGSKSARLSQLEDQIAADPDFWNDPAKSSKVLKEKKVLELAVNRAERLETTKEDLAAAIELAGEDREYLEEAQRLLESLNTELEALEVQLINRVYAYLFQLFSHQLFQAFSLAQIFAC